jgi:hypothetical protein
LLRSAFCARPENLRRSLTASRISAGPLATGSGPDSGRSAARARSGATIEARSLSAGWAF